MRRKYVALLLVICLLMGGCQSANLGSQGTAPTTNRTEPLTTTATLPTTVPTPTTLPAETLPAPTEPELPMELAFAAKYVRVGDYLDIAYPVVSLITSATELQAHCDAYSLYCDQPIFQSSIIKYTDAYFAEKALILILKYEGTQSISHKVTGVTQVAKDHVTVAVDRQCPEGGNDVIAIWYLLVEVEGTFAPGTEVDVAWTDVAKEVPMQPREPMEETQPGGLQTVDYQWECIFFPISSRFENGIYMVSSADELRSINAELGLQIEYEDDFFESNTLVISVHHEGGSPYTHNVTGLHRTSEGEYILSVDRIHNEYTADICCTSILIVEVSEIIPKDVEIEVEVTDIITYY